MSHEKPSSAQPTWRVLPPWRDAVLRIVVPYLVFAAAWILLSDRGLNLLTQDPQQLERLQNVKGVAFVLVTAALLYVLLRREFSRREQLSAEHHRLAASLQSFVENVEDYSIVLLDPDGLITTWNAGAERIFRFRAAEIIGRHCRTFYLPEEIAQGIVEVGLKNARTNGVHHDHGWRLRQDGSRFWATSTITAIQNEAGTLLGFARVTRDETERRRAEEELRQREEQYRLLFDRNPHPMWVFDLETLRFLAVNDAAIQHYGYSREEFLSMTIKDIQPADQVPKLLAALPKPSQGTNRAGPWQHKRKDGSLIDVEVASHEITFAGRAAQLVLPHDVTEQNRASRALRDSEERYHTLAAIAPVGIFRTDLGGRCLYVNERWCDISGMRAGAALGNGWSSALHPEDRRKVLAEWDRAAQKGLPFEMEYRFRRADGRVVTVFGQASAIRDGAGAVVGFVGTITDLTARKQSENTLRELTARLLVVQDEERRRLARELHDTTSQNLAAMGINLALLGQQPAPSTDRAAALLRDCVLLAEDTAREIRTLSHILHPPLLEVAGLTGALRELARGFSTRSSIQIETDFPSDFGRLSPEHEAALLRVAQEGLANIHRHSGSRSGRLRLRRDAERVTLDVEDSGAGIPPERLEALQRDDTVVGVGIAGMRERLRQLGGQLILTSGTGGTLVQAVLPLHST